VFELPHPRADGATHLLLDPLELIEKLTRLIPPPRFPASTTTNHDIAIFKTGLDADPPTSVARRC